MDQERIALLSLRFIPGIGDFLIKQLVSYCGSADQVFKMPKGKLLKIPGIGKTSAEAIKSEKTFHLAELELKKAEKEETEILFFIDKKYPSRLKTIDDAPAILYFKGTQNLNVSKTVGIVGTRQATEYGKEVVEQICRDLIPHNVLIISGLAYGIDIHAHKHSIINNLPTLGVLGSGIDIIYPASHKDTARKMINHGGLLSENPFGTKPDAHNFPARNRIIAGISDALIVVEAAEKGGALITAEIANSYNKDVFAVPGNIGAAHSAGCNKLIKTNKANLFSSVKDLEYIMNWTGSQENQLTQRVVIENLESDELQVVNILKENNRPMIVDEIIFRSSLHPSKLASLLLTLEFKNIVKSLPGKQFQLKT